MKRVRVTSAVAKKLIESIEYLQEVCQMGGELEQQIRVSLQRIQRYPRMYPVVGLGETRRVVIPKFGYTLFYEVRENEILVKGLLTRGENSPYS